MYIKRLARAVGVRRNPKLQFVDVDKLYFNTLYRSDKIRPWAIKEGKYKAIELKQNFAASYLSLKKDFDYNVSDYYQYIIEYNAENYTGIYEGNESWAYSNADNMCNRYIAMINLILKYLSVYNRLNKKNLHPSFRTMYRDIIDFEKNNQVEIRYIVDNRQSIRKESSQYNESATILEKTYNKRLIGHLVPTGKFLDGKIVCCNGTHRLALFKALHDKGLYTNLFPIYLLNRR